MVANGYYFHRDGGLFAWISYIAPLVTNVSGLEANRVPLIMVLIGVGMFFGNLLGGKLADTISPTKAAIASFSSMAICLVIVFLSLHLNGQRISWPLLQA